jgi:hypothetical protein
MANLVHVKEQIERFRNGAKRMREKSKEAMMLVGTTALAAATAGGIGALDEAKGETVDHDEGIRCHNLGPLPTSLVVAAVGKTAAVLNLGDSAGELASSVGQGGLDAFSYVMGRRLWIRHQSNQNAGK